MAESSEHWKIEKGLCRCCHSEGSFHQLSDICIVGEEEGFYADMLQLTLNISMKPVEKPLNMICDNCVHRVKDATAFKQQVLRCEAQFHEMYTKGVIKVGLTSVVKEEPESDGNDDSKMDAGGFEDNDEANTDVADSQSEPLAEVGLELCKKEPLTEDTDNRRKSLRTKKATSILEISLLTPKQQKPKQKPKPSKKLKKTKDASAAEDSTSKDTDVDGASKGFNKDSLDDSKYYKCDECGKQLKSKNSIRDHIKKQHLKTPNLKCYVCDEKFVDKKQRIWHLLKCHKMEQVKLKGEYTVRPAQNVVCGVCKKEFPAEFLLTTHTQIHTLRKCPECPLKFTKRKLIFHKANAHGVKIPTCGVCGYRNISPSDIIIHQRKIHMKEKDFSCPSCEHKAFSATALKKHMVKHNPEKKFECSHCKKMFPRKNTLLEHERIHTGDKRKVCKLCDEKFVQKASLNYHIVKHHPETC
ncbi:zinc finger protein 2-like isoform X3 [Plodia interpunctella]|uniref:zinc finger protein 2-like isoform X3 n=1 Tax=Plodia interpunctella TaxID=58824 RepID=UPI002367DC7F|nr:zinc finger protein 2-like isoform X3 [Plodia interpunctella]